MAKLSTYDTAKKVIINQKAKGLLDVEEMMIMLDTFLLGGRITNDEYNELVALVNS